MNRPPSGFFGGLVRVCGLCYSGGFMTPWRLLPFATAIGIGGFFPTLASAHLVNTNVGEFYTGMLHPLTSAEHLLPTLALAVLAIQCGKQAARTTLFAFPLALLAGTLAGSQLIPFTAFHVANLVVLVGLGGLLSLGDRLYYIRPAAVGALSGPLHQTKPTA